MSQDFLPFAKPLISSKAIEEVVACLESGWITTGPRVKQFEEDLANYLQAPHVLALSSATAGLHLALLTVNIEPGDEIITTPLTFVCTLNTIVHAGAKPVLVDIDPDTFNMDVNKIKEVITPRTKAIIPVHFTGLPVDLDPIYALAEQHNLRVIEDAAQAMGTQYKNQIVGSFGDMQIFSFHPNKNMTTGEGGCFVTRDAERASKIAALRFHGIDRKTSQHYDVVTPGYKYNMMDIQAALGLHQLCELEQFIERRTYLANRYNQHLTEWPQVTLQAAPTYTYRHSWHLYTVLINPESAGMDRDTFMERMKNHNIGTGLHFCAAHLFDFYRQKYGYKPGDYPVAENIGARIVSLPLFPSMTDAEQDRVLHAMHQIFNEQGALG